jgi:WD40 repeat protein/predicted Ser/Thr protein kinase
MNEVHTCKNCGASFAASGGETSYCPSCILRQGLLSTVDSLPSDPGPASPPIFGSYELFEEIGRGGMGVVYKAWQRNLKRTVAIKLLVSGAYSSESLLRRFQIEAESAASLQHPGIVAIYEFGENDSQPFYAMEFVEGKNLSELAGGQPLAPHRAAAYVRAIAEAVQYAHTRGILHRDLKPSNVLVDLNDRPRITDFGLAKQLHAHSDVTAAGQMLGSPNYAPPEQAAGKEVGVTSDVYSLGGLLYNLLTGRPPFLAGTVQETLRLVYETEPISPRILNPDVPQDLETICLKCLEKHPERRYDSAQALSDELSRFARGEPILARPVSTAEQGMRWCRRHPAIASLAATIVLALTATSVIFYVSAKRVERARDLEAVAQGKSEENLYAANMQAASGALLPAGGFDRGGLRTSLDDTRPLPGKRDFRGFEWRHFWFLTLSDALATLKGHTQVVDAAFFSPDGGHAATHSLDGNLRVWDSTTMREILSLDDVACPGGFTADGSHLIFSRRDNSIWRLDISTKETTKMRGGEGQLIEALPDGRSVVLFGSDKMPVLRALDEPVTASNIPDVPVDTCAVVSVDGRRVAVAGRPYPGILVIDLVTGKRLAAFLDLRAITALAISPDGSQVVSAGFNGVLKVWSVASGALETEFKAFLDPIWGIAYSQDGRFLAGGGNNRSLKVWDTSSWTEGAPLLGHDSTVRCVAFSPDGQRMISGSEDELAMIWPSHSHGLQTEMPQLLRGPRWIDRTPCIAFSPDSRLFAGTAADGTIKVWRTDTIACTATFPEDARTVAFSPDGKTVLGEGYNGTVQRWDLNGSEAGRTIMPKARFANWQVDPLSSQERVTLVADQNESIATCQLCEITSSRDGINAGAMLSTTTIVLSEDGRTMYVGLPQGGVEVWDVATRKRRFAFAAHKLGVSALAVSPDGRYLATGSLDNSTVLWTADTGQRVATFHAHNRPVWALAFSPDGQTLAAGSCDKEIILCSVPLKRHVASLSLYTGTPKGFEQEVRLMRFSPDGNILAAALGDGTVRFFRAAPFSETDSEPPAKDYVSAP